MVSRPDAARAVQLAELEVEQIQMLRLRQPTEEVLSAVGRTLGVSLPETPNRASGGHPRAIWMGPGEWMIVGTKVNPDTLGSVLNGTVALAVDVGHGRYALDVSGPRARDFLAKAISIDLAPDRFPEDSTAMTLFAQVPVVIDRCQPTMFRLWFDISYRNYVRLWCSDALIEFDA